MLGASEQMSEVPPCLYAVTTAFKRVKNTSNPRERRCAAAPGHAQCAGYIPNTCATRVCALHHMKTSMQADRGEEGQGAKSSIGDLPTTSTGFAVNGR